MSPSLSDRVRPEIPGSEDIVSALKSAEQRLMDLDGRSQSAEFLEAIDDLRDLRRLAFTMWQVAQRRESRQLGPIPTSGEELVGALATNWPP